MIRDALKDLSRRTFLKGTAGAALGGSALSLLGRPAFAADLKTVRFSEAVHNLGYINLYVGMHSDIFKKNGLDMRRHADLRGGARRLG
jgi:NitT/TauT family transport system substrate-binding protein